MEKNTFFEISHFFQLEKIVNNADHMLITSKTCAIEQLMI